MTQNPFAAPEAPPTSDADSAWSAPFGSIWELIGRSLSFYFANLPTIAGITLAVFAPVEILKQLAMPDSGATDPMTAVRVEMLIESVFGTLVSASLLQAFVIRIDQGRAVGIAEGLSLGIGRWGRVFAARFYSGLLMVLGLIALIVPGIIIAVRYALTDEVAALEDEGTATTLQRSKALVAGHGWQIFGLGGVVNVGSLIALSILGALGPMLGITAASIAFDCVGDVVFRFLNVVFFLAYLSLARAPGSRTVG